MIFEPRAHSRAGKFFLYFAANTVESLREVTRRKRARSGTRLMALTIECSKPGLALFLGSAIGFKRQWHQKMAGLRTNALRGRIHEITGRRGRLMAEIGVPSAR